MPNKYTLYYKKPSKHSTKDTIIILIIILLLIISIKTKVYETKEVVALYHCEEECIITFPISYKEIDILKDSEIKYDGKTINKEIQVSEPYLDNGIAYEDIEIKEELDTDSKIVNLKIYFKKENIMKKISKIIGG